MESFVFLDRRVLHRRRSAGESLAKVNCCIFRSSQAHFTIVIKRAKRCMVPK